MTVKTQEEEMEMLREIGARSFEEIISQLPSRFLNPGFNFNEKALTENGLFSKFKEFSSRNKKVLSFAGAGAYERYVPALSRYIAQRGEFLTAYTPYQAEASQGLLQTIYEYQSEICSLYEMDAANASLYDGATALAEAVKACVRITGKNGIIYPQALNPEYLKTLKTYMGEEKNYRLKKIGCPDGVLDLGDLESALAAKDAACMIVQNPNFWGALEDLGEISTAARRAGALFVVCADPLSLGLLAPPGACGADFAVGEGQGLGLPLNYGGPYLGIFSCKKQYIRQMPGRLAGITKDREGKRGFVLTLQAREQHIRRSRAASNICSNEALCALMAGIYLTLLGPEGIKEAAVLNHRNAVLTLEKIRETGKAALKFDRPFFNEFVVDLGGDPRELRKKALEEEGMDIGIPLGEIFGGKFENSLLVCATETKTESDINRLARFLEKNP